MKVVFAIAVSVLTFVLSAREVHAIVVLPALLLIPIAKVIAVVIAGFSIPAGFIGGLISKVKGQSVKRGVTVAIGLLVILALIVGVIIKIINPERSIF